MTPAAKQKIQLVLVALIAVAAVRAGYIWYQRRPDAREAKEKEARKDAPLNPDYYVIPKKLYPYDLKSAKQLTQQPVWVKEGYRYTYYPYEPVSKRADFSKEAGLLLPIERLEIKDVVLNPSPKGSGEKQMMATFQKDGKGYAVPIGTLKGDSYQMYSDEMFYIQDPHDLYKHWSAEVWDAIGRHEVKPGMNELQADFAIGMGVPERSSDPATKTVNYPNGGKPMSIRYQNGKAAEIKSAAAA